MCQSIKHPKEVHEISVIDTINKYALVAPIKERLGVEELAAMIINFDNNGIDGFNEIVYALVGRGYYTYTTKKLDIDLKNRAIPSAKPSI